VCVFAVYISEKQLLVLNFRGLSFEFRIDPKLEVSDELNKVVLIVGYILISTSVVSFVCIVSVSNLFMSRYCQVAIC